MQLTHQRACEVFGFLTDFAERYPDLCEVDRAMYRDLCRAALVAIDDEERCESMRVQCGIDAVLFRVCREDIGARLVRQLRAAGVKLRWDGKTLHCGPREKISQEIHERIVNWKHAIRDALLTESLSDPKLCKRA